MQRTRSRVQEELIQYGFRYIQSGVTYTVPESETQWRYFSEITDSIDRTVYNHPCYHVTLSSEPEERPIWTWEGHEYTELGGGPWLRWLPDPRAWVVQYFDGVISSDDLSDFSEDAFDAFSEQVPQQVDIINFGLDLRQIGDLIPKLEESMGKTTSSGFLNYEFGWAPFLGDLQKLGRLSKTVADRLAWLRDTYGKPVRLGFAREFDYPPNRHPVPTTSSMYPSLDTSRVLLRATGTLYHELEHLSGAEGTVRGMIAALGLNNPLGVVWERIPYSFVVDWFARTKRVVDAFKVQPFNGLWNIYNVCHTWEFHLSQTWHLLEPGIRTHVVGHLVGDVYNRHVGLPVTGDYFTRDLSPTQQLLAVALLSGAAR